MSTFRERLSQMTEAEALERLGRLLADVQGTPDLVEAHDLDRGLRGQRESELLRELRRAVSEGHCGLDAANAMLAMLELDAGRRRLWWHVTWGQIAASRAS
jgi:hypothetical protein